ncbi:universal stress protein [Planctomycetes bacterium TBK1r]|uniref:Universal stress protein UspE n=1 Tax=Stieleria magnilauensis TaxID=2527963 RepID=A0ABX5XUU2_9BACT|nr:universal stress protein UspE [Planctomycetes bacterium TBK1r]
MNYFENQKLLAPYDFSKFSQSAIDTAMKIAGKNENVTVLHVVDPSPLYGYSGDMGMELGAGRVLDLPNVDLAAEIDADHQAQALKMLHGELGDARHHGLNYDTIVDEPAHGIAAYAESNEFDLIVLPSHGRTGFKRLLIGSTAERVVRLAHCPVMVLRL